MTVAIYPKEAGVIGANSISPLRKYDFTVPTGLTAGNDYTYDLPQDVTIGQDEILAIGEYGDGNESIRYRYLSGVSPSGNQRFFGGALIHVGNNSSKSLWHSMNFDLGYRGNPPVANVPVTGVTMSKNSTTIDIGESDTVTATIAPVNATDATMSWSKANNNVNITSDGNTCTITGVSIGSSIVTATTTDGSFTATCAVTVRDNTIPPPVNPPDDPVPGEDDDPTTDEPSEGDVTYAHFKFGSTKVRVDAAIRDGAGRKIETMYVRSVNGVTPVDGNIDLGAIGFDEYAVNILEEGN